MSRSSRARGFSLIEVMVALVIITLAMVAAVQLIGSGSAGVVEAESTGRVRDAAASMMQVVSALRFGDPWEGGTQGDAARFAADLAEVVSGEGAASLAGYSLWMLATAEARGGEVRLRVPGTVAGAPDVADLRLRVERVPEGAEAFVAVFPGAEEAWRGVPEETQEQTRRYLASRSDCLHVVVESRPPGAGEDVLWTRLQSRMFVDAETR